MKGYRKALQNVKHSQKLLDGPVWIFLLSVFSFFLFLFSNDAILEHISCLENCKTALREYSALKKIGARAMIYVHGSLFKGLKHQITFIVPEYTLLIYIYIYFGKSFNMLGKTASKFLEISGCEK